VSNDDWCTNCDGRKCMDCVLRYEHDACEDSCPFCCDHECTAPANPHSDLIARARKSYRSLDGVVVVSPRLLADLADALEDATRDVIAWVPASVLDGDDDETAEKLARFLRAKQP